MSSTTLESTPSRRGATPDPGRTRSGNGSSTGPGPSFLRVLNSEFIKFRTLLSTLILLGSTVLVVVGFGALSAWGTGQFSRGRGAGPAGRRRVRRAGRGPRRQRPHLRHRVRPADPGLPRRAADELRVHHGHGPLHLRGGAQADPGVRRQAAWWSW